MKVWPGSVDDGKLAGMALPSPLASACLSICLVLVSGCSRDSSLRIRNTTDRKWENVVVAGLSFGTVEAGETTGYKPYRPIQGQTQIECTLRGQRLQLLPFEWEALSKTGRKTVVWERWGSEFRPRVEKD